MNGEMPSAEATRNRTGQLGALAVWQLEKWREFARHWRLGIAYNKDGVPYLACTWCQRHILWLVDPNGIEYSWEFEQLQAQLITHLRNIHRDLEEKVYSG